MLLLMSESPEEFNVTQLWRVRKHPADVQRRIHGFYSNAQTARHAQNQGHNLDFKSHSSCAVKFFVGINRIWHLTKSVTNKQP